MRLRISGYVLETCADAPDAAFRLEHESYDLAIIDSGLRSAVHVLERARKQDAFLPILVSHQGRDPPAGRVLCLDAGADDCVDQGMHMDEVMARIRSLLRRNRMRRPELTCGDLHFDSNSRLFRIGNLKLSLPSKEHAILEALITQPGRMHSKRELANTLYSLQDAVSSDTVQLYVHRLRKRLRGTGVDIETHRGLGYLMRVASDSRQTEAA